MDLMPMLTVRPEDFAADGDVPDLYLGVKDATAAVAAAFAAINAAGGQARLLLEGKYRVSTPLVLPYVDGLCIEGAGGDSGFIVDPTFPAESSLLRSDDALVLGRGVLSSAAVAAP